MTVFGPRGFGANLVHPLLCKLRLVDRANSNWDTAFGEQTGFAGTAGTVLSSNTENFTIGATTKTLKLAFDRGNSVTVTLTEGSRTAAQVVADINAAIGATVASDESGAVQLTSTWVGYYSRIAIETVADDAYTVLGFTVSDNDGTQTGGVVYFYPDVEILGQVRYSDLKAAVFNPSVIDQMSRGYMIFLKRDLRTALANHVLPPGRLPELGDLIVQFDDLVTDWKIENVRQHAHYNTADYFVVEFVRVQMSGDDQGLGDV